MGKTRSSFGIADQLSELNCKAQILLWRSGYPLR